MLGGLNVVFVLPWVFFFNSVSLNLCNYMS